MIIPEHYTTLANRLGKDIKDIKIIVGMSGGVDSSVSALLLKQAGFCVEGLFMKNWEEDDGTKHCTALTDLADAKKVADALGIVLHTANFAHEYWERVFEHFLAEYKAMRTPNPDILCNKEIKFKAFLDYAQSLGADFIATGHYAQKAYLDGNTYLLRGADENKDQSYFLHAVSSEKIAKTIFPIGHLQKPMVRKLAQQHMLATAHKKDSTGICFIGERRFKDFLAQYLPAQQGDIVSDDGIVIGKHDGLMYYTIGQRQGLGIGGVKNYPDAPWFVIKKDVKNNRLIVAQTHDHPKLLSQTLYTATPDWVNGAPNWTQKKLTAKTRYRQNDQPCTVFIQPNGMLKVDFNKPVRAITAGQSCVLYDGAICLGGGVIEQTQ